MEKHIEILNERFSKDSLMALATVDAKGIPWVRTIDAIFYKDSFFSITYPGLDEWSVGEIEI